MSQTININNTTPAPPTGATNVLWQNDTSSPPNISAYVPGLLNANIPNGLYNFNSATQSQLTVAATKYYITKSNINLPATLFTGIVIGTAFTWRLHISKDANNTGAFNIIIFRGTLGTSGDTADVSQAQTGVQTAALDDMVVDVQLVFTAVGASGSYFWTINTSHSAASAAGFGCTTGTQSFTGTVSSVNTTTASLIFGLGFVAAAGATMVTVSIPYVEAQAYNLN
jgi:hypothetical protein